jgi:hypothetical protein
LASAGVGGLLLPSLAAAEAQKPPVNDPAAAMQQSWTASLNWNEVLDITRVAGSSWEDRLARAQSMLVARGGGVVYFPPGVYHFHDTIRVRSGVILRGAPPTSEPDPRQPGYALTSRLEFPRFAFTAEGDGTALDTAFKAIELDQPESASNCGLVHLAINRSHILFREGKDHACGRNRLVLGCLLTNTAFADAAIPDRQIGQHLWQRFTWRFGAAIDVKSAENLLIAANCIPTSGDDNFTMNGFVVSGRNKTPVSIDGVVFDYDNRPGIYANHVSLGGPGGNGPDGTPETHPHGFRKGTVIAHNFVYCTGRCAIGFSGDGVVAKDNVIRFQKDVWRPTATGRDLTHGSSTNDNRAIEMRGWRWHVAHNDYAVYRNWCYDRKYPINDGEGLMHEDHVNSTVKDSVLAHNCGNAYISIYRTGGIDGLLIEGNDIRPPQSASSIGAIYVVANRNSGNFPCRNVRIVNNIVGSHITLAGYPVENNLIQSNRAAKATSPKLINQAGAKLLENEGFTAVES